MTRPFQFRLLIAWLPVVTFGMGGADKIVANEPAIAGYLSYEELRRELEDIASDPAAELQSLGTTLGGREIFALTLSIGEASQKPAILVVGSVHAPHLLGSELAVRMARRLIDGAESDEAIQRVLEETTIYVVPLPSPDASEAFFHKPYFERTGNARATDDDRDGRTNEDGPEDLDGDGQITLMRIEDPSGPYMPHPADARILIEADPKKEEQGRYRIEIEGIDNDRDEAQGEDGPGGVAFDRNFTFEYPYFNSGAGPHQISEPETRAVADFAFDHPNIFLVFSFSPHDNLMNMWKSGEQRGSIPTSVHADDVPYLDHVAKKYQDGLDAKAAPEPPGAEGSFVHWAYFHYGRWSLGARGWWVPDVPDTTASEDHGNDQAEESSDEQSTEKSREGDEDGNLEGETLDEKRDLSEVNALRWLEQQGIEGFAEWAANTHPDYPNRSVEVGGFYPYVRLNPPAGELTRLADTHTRFLAELASLRPRLSVSIEKLEHLGDDVYRITAQVRNDGYLPTESAMGSRADTLQRLEMRIELPDGAQLVHGVARTSIGRLVGQGRAQQREWLLRMPDPRQSKTIKVVAGSPTTGTVETSRDLPEAL